MVWAALSLMTSIPVKNGKNCVFQVVRVSGTIRKAEEEAIRRSRELILKARREAEGRGDSTLKSIFGKDNNHAEAKSTKDVLMVERSDSEEEEELSDGDG
jgi:ribonuclease P/MRP protein subunit POP5